MSLSTGGLVVHTRRAPCVPAPATAFPLFLSRRHAAALPKGQLNQFSPTPCSSFLTTVSSLIKLPVCSCSRLRSDATKLRDRYCAAKGACLNIAEAAGRVTRADKARVFTIARGEKVARGCCRRRL